MKIKKFNEELHNVEEKNLIDKYNNIYNKYEIKLIDNQGNDLYTGYSRRSLDEIVKIFNDIEAIKEPNTYYYIIEEIRSTKIITREEIEFRSQTNKYNL